MVSSLLTPVATLAFISMFAEMFWKLAMRRAVKGSHERYVLSTKRRIAAWATIVALVMIGVISIGMQFYFAAPLNFFVAYLNIKTELADDEDDWFNGRWKKLKAGAKSRLKSLAVKPQLGLNPSGA
jgi:hypothetical protein